MVNCTLNSLLFLLFWYHIFSCKRSSNILHNALKYCYHNHSIWHVGTCIQPPPCGLGELNPSLVWGVGESWRQLWRDVKLMTPFLTCMTLAVTKQHIYSIVLCSQGPDLSPIHSDPPPTPPQLPSFASPPFHYVTYSSLFVPQCSLFIVISSSLVPCCSRQG